MAYDKRQTLSQALGLNSKIMTAWESEHWDFIYRYIWPTHAERIESVGYKNAIDWESKGKDMLRRWTDPGADADKY